jgi:tetratricopeptide (TPR) repeat protein
MVVLAPDKVPANVDRDRYFEAIAALEQTGRLDEAALAWRTAGQMWPGNTVTLFGLGNVQFATGNFTEAETTYRNLLNQDGRLLVARNNLALALAEQGEFDAAIEEIGIALARNHDPALEPELRDTEMTIQSMLESRE